MLTDLFNVLPEPRIRYKLLMDVLAYAKQASLAGLIAPTVKVPRLDSPLRSWHAPVTGLCLLQTHVVTVVIASNATAASGVSRLVQGLEVVKNNSKRICVGLRFNRRMWRAGRASGS